MPLRAILLSSAAALLAASATAGGAVAQTRGEQAEWAQNYDGASRIRIPRSLTPILSAGALAATEQAAERYRQLAGSGGWGTLQAPNLRVGTRSPAVAALRQRLTIEGDLDASAGSSDIYDSYVEAAVKRFQSRHGLNTTGALNQATVTAMNVPVELRLKQLELNVQRLRTYQGADLGRRFVITNLPAALVETVENGQVVTRHAAGVGKPDRASPIMNTKATSINFNPFWTVPASIIKKDLIPKMQKEPSYLSDNHIRIIGKGGQEIQPAAVNWRSDEATHYQFRQDPGGDVNSLGFVRINIGNPYGVYMHDTPSKGIFGDDFRFVSSGCVRVQNVRDYITWLLKDTPGWDREHVEQALDSGQRIDANLTQPVPVYWVYVTAWAAPDGLVQFRDDIYNKDGLGNIPVASRTPVEPDDSILNN